MMVTKHYDQQNIKTLLCGFTIRTQLDNLKHDVMDNMLHLAF